MVDNNEASIGLHKSLGFSEVGHFKNAGYKLGAWRGILWMVKEIVGSDEEPAKPLELSRIVR